MKKPCATGIMSLTMRADGVLSFCRLQTDNAEDTLEDKRSLQQIKKVVDRQMKNFKDCYHNDSQLV